MIKPQHTKAIDLLFAIPVTALTGSLSFFMLSYMSMPNNLSINTEDIKIIISLVVMVFFPISILAIIPAYFGLRHFNKLGAVQSSSIGVIVGGILSITLSVKNIQSGILITMCSVLASLAGYAALSFSANRRARNRNA